MTSAATEWLLVVRAGFDELADPAVAAIAEVAALRQQLADEKAARVVAELAAANAAAAANGFLNRLADVRNYCKTVDPQLPSTQVLADIADLIAPPQPR